MSMKGRRLQPFRAYHSRKNTTFSQAQEYPNGQNTSKALYLENISDKCTCRYLNCILTSDVRVVTTPHIITRKGIQRLVLK